MTTPAAWLAIVAVLLGAAGAWSNEPVPRRSATGPLRIHEKNSRYFTDGSGKPIYLTGSHTWANLIDRGESDPPPEFDFEGYLDLLEKHDHNFVRLWSRQVSWYQKYGEKELHAVPLAWPRTGPGKALDGKPKFDLSTFNQAYFDRLRSRVAAAGERGIYVSVMLLGGYQEAEANWTGNPFHRDNNINGIDGDPNGDGNGAETHTLGSLSKGVADAQQRYVQKVIDTVGDLDNVLFEIANEAGSSSKEWQYDLIDFIHRYEKSKPKQHPVGMTAGWWSIEQTREILDASPADWVSYQFDVKPPRGQEPLDVNDPFVAAGNKVSIQDSDHWWVVSIYGNPAFGRQWVWKSFCRGHNPILMEHLPPQSFIQHDHPLSLDDPGYIASRQAMGHTRRLADRMNLAEMTPRNELASTSFCLANPGQEYLVYLPEGGEVTVELSKAEGTFKVEWHNPATGKTRGAEPVSGGMRREFKAPFEGDAVLYLRR